MFNRRSVLVLGDSHALVFQSKYIKALLPSCKFHVCSVLGATVSGLDNPNSKTNAINIFNEAIQNNNQVNNVIFLLGEVDTGFVIWYRAQKYASSVDEMLSLALKNYEQLLMSEALKVKKLIVISAPLPTIRDGNDWGDVASARKEIKATIEERTQLTLQFNSMLKSIVTGLGHTFIDLDKFSLSTANKGAKRFLRNINKRDHHYNHLFYSLLIAFRLKRIKFIK